MSTRLGSPFRSPAEDEGSGPGMWWKFGGAGVGVATASVVRWTMERGRRRLSPRGDVPLNPADERMGWPPALAWAAFIAVGGAIGRLVTQRAMAAVWRKRTHRPVTAMPST